MAEGRGLEPKSLGGVLITPGGCCGEARLEASPQAFAGARRARDWLRSIALQPDEAPFFLEGIEACVVKEFRVYRPRLRRADDEFGVCDQAGHANDAAIAAIDRNRMNWSSRDGVKPRRRQNAAASSSTALTMSARPPTRPATVTQRSRACLIRPVPMPRPAQERSVAS